MFQKEESVQVRLIKWQTLLLNYDVSMYQALDSVELMGLSPKITKAAAEFTRLNE